MSDSDPPAATTNISVVNSTRITATASPHTRGRVDVVVRNPNAESATLTSAYRYGLLDPDGDGAITILDVFFIINRVFHAGPMPHGQSSMDANGDGLVNGADAIYVLSYLFGGGQEPH